MRNVHDTFLHFLADNLSGIPVKEVRREPNSPRQIELAMNHVNVNFLDLVYDPHIPALQVSIDIVHDDQLTAMTWTEQVYALLGAAFMTPLYDYSSVASGGQPVLQPSNIFWKKSVRFRTIKSDYYMHYSAILTLYHHV